MFQKYPLHASAHRARLHNVEGQPYRNCTNRQPITAIELFKSKKSDPDIFEYLGDHDDLFCTDFSQIRSALYKNYYKQTKSIIDQESPEIQQDLAAELCHIGIAYHTGSGVLPNLQQAKKMYKVSAHYGSQYYKTASLYKLGLVYDELDNPEKAQEKLVAALADQTASKGDKECMAGALYKVARKYSKRNGQNDLARAQECFALVCQKGDEKFQAYAHGELGYVYLKQEKLTEAHKELEIALKSNFVKPELKANYATCLFEVGIALQKNIAQKEKIEQAADCYQLCYEYIPNQLKPEVSSSLGGAYTLLGQITEAEKHFAHALQSQDSTSKVKAAVASWYNLLGGYYIIGEIVPRSFQKAYDFFTFSITHGKPQIQASAHIGLATLFYAKSEHEQCLASLRELYNIQQASQDEKKAGAQIATTLGLKLSQSQTVNELKQAHECLTIAATHCSEENKTVVAENLTRINQLLEQKQAAESKK